MKLPIYIAMVSVSAICAVLLSERSSTRLDIWIEQRGRVYAACQRPGSFDPIVNYAMFTFPVMVRTRVLRQPPPLCSAIGVRFPQGPKLERLARREQVKDFAALVLAVMYAWLLARVIAAFMRVRV